MAIQISKEDWLETVYKWVDIAVDMDEHGHTYGEPCGFCNRVQPEISVWDEKREIRIRCKTLCPAFEICEKPGSLFDQFVDAYRNYDVGKLEDRACHILEWLQDYGTSKNWC